MSIPPLIGSALGREGGDSHMIYFRYQCLSGFHYQVTKSYKMADCFQLCLFAFRILKCFAVYLGIKSSKTSPKSFKVC